MFQKLPVNGFKWIIDVTKIDEEFIRNYNEDNDKEYILAVDLSILKNYMIYIATYHFYLKE